MQFSEVISRSLLLFPYNVEISHFLHVNVFGRKKNLLIFIIKSKITVLRCMSCPARRATENMLAAQTFPGVS